MPLLEVPIASLRPIVHCLTCGLMRARMRAVVNEELFTLLSRGEEITCYTATLLLYHCYSVGGKMVN